MYHPAEASSFARDDVVGRRRGAASGVWGARTYYSLAAAGRNRGDERGVRLELDAAAYLTRYLRLTFGQNDNKTGVLFSLRPTPLGTQNRVETGGQYDSSTTLERVALSFCPKPFIIFVAEIFLNEWLWGVAPCPKMHQKCCNKNRVARKLCPDVSRTIRSCLNGVAPRSVARDLLYTVLLYTF